ncbi:MAG: anaerobic ribonucleoside-triphosphate reductase activating protein [Bacteroidales bacterium]|nr:anaerobic ribonucleoside-triphosphate reductase activating protein [Bacteroidales bacterium]
MLRLAGYDIVFQEVPGEVTLALNISGCTLHCKGCHSPHLWEDIGEILDQEALCALLRIYNGAITCVCFMGGNASEGEVEKLCDVVRRAAPGVKTAWYSGKAQIPEWVDKLNYLKIGPYMADLGGLASPSTNQRFYKVDNGTLSDLTHIFYTK